MTKEKTKKIIEWIEKEVAVSDLIPFERNPRKISEQAFNRLVADIRANGYHQRIIATPDLRVIGGHQRIKALSELGIKTIKVLVPDQPISDEKFKEMLVKDNLPFGEFDFEKLMEDYNFDEMIGYGMPEDWLAGLKVSEVDLPELNTGDKEPFQQITFTLADEQAGSVKEALAISKKLGVFEDTGNENSNGNELARICETFITQNGNG